MKLALLIELVTLMVATQGHAKDLQQLELPDPQNWIVGDRLFPVDVIAGYSDDYDKYTSETWAAYILSECQGQDACTSTISNSGINSGTPKDRYWFGYTFRGGPTTVDDYERYDGTEDSIVYTISD